MSGKAKRRGREALPMVAAVSLAIAVAVTVALSGLIAPGGDGPRALVPLPDDQGPAWGAGWSSLVEGPERLEAAALTEGAVRAAAGLAALASLALLTALLRLVGLREALRPALAVRWAIGASPRSLARGLLVRVRARLTRAWLVGLVGGVALAALLRASWPVEGAGGAPSLAVLAVAAALLVPVLLALASPLLGLADRSVPLLRTGSGGTDDPRAGTVRRAAATLQLGAAVALVLAGATLGTAGGIPEGEESVAGGDTLLVPLRPLNAGLDWSAVERLIGATAPESLSTPGAWTGRGVRDLVTVECGRCSRGGLPLPIYGVEATVHAVSPGFFAGAGLELIEGRGFTAADGPDAPPVGIVSAPFARDHFEAGRPLGKRIRLGGGGDRWVTVVGVVEPLPYEAPGSAPPGAAVLYLPIGQHPAASVVWAVPGAANERQALPASVPVEAVGEPVTLEEARSAARAPVRWIGRILLGAGLSGLILALAGAADVAGAEARGRWREAAVRSAVGAPPVRLALRFLRRVAVTALFGAGVGWLMAWSLVASVGGGAAIPPSLALSLGGLLLAATLAGAMAPARRAAGADPAVLLREGG